MWCGYQEVPSAARQHNNPETFDLRPRDPTNPCYELIQYKHEQYCCNFCV